MFSPVEEIKSRIDIVELIGSYVRLQKAGANFKALCPFHTERTASFNVSPARQIWHCFGCSKGGDIFRFIMDIEGMDFPEALKFLADRAGVVIKREDPAIRSERNRLLALMEEAAKFFENQLMKFSVPLSYAKRETGGESLRKETPTTPLHYLKNRGLKDETIKKFRLGYAPNEWRALSSHLSQKGFTAAEMEKAGLVTKSQTTNNKQQTSHYDRFRGRIMFPIFDYQGRVIAFGGRILEVPTSEGAGTPTDSVGAKYINSPETALYQKNKVLYGLHAAKNDILKNGQAVVVEGYMDMIMSYQSGVCHVVASSGTALGMEQMRIMRRLCERLVMAFDMDQAGQAAAGRGIQLALENGFDITVMDLGKYKDPADAARDDPVFFQNAVNSARHIVQFYIDSVAHLYAPHAPEGKRACERVVLPVVASLSSELERAHWVRVLGELLRISEEVLWRALSRIRSGNTAQPENESLADSGERVLSRKRLLEERLLGMLASSPLLASRHLARVNDTFFARDQLAILFHLRDEAVLADSARAALGRIALETDIMAKGITDWEEEFSYCYRELEKEHIKEQMGKLSLDIRRAEQESPAGLPALLSQFQKLSQQLSQFHSP